MKKATKTTPFLQNKITDFFNIVPDKIKECFKNDEYECSFVKGDRWWEYLNDRGIITITNFKNQDTICPGDCKLSLVYNENDVLKFEDDFTAFLMEFTEVTFIAKQKDSPDIWPNFDSYRIIIKKLKDNTFDIMILQEYKDDEYKQIGNDKIVVGKSSTKNVSL